METIHSPTSFADALYLAYVMEEWAALRTVELGSTVRSDLTILAETFHQPIFNLEKPLGSDAMIGFFAGASELFTRVCIGQSLPFAWFGLFFDLFKIGQISSEAWGAAARLLYTGIGPAIDGTNERHSAYLEGFRAASRDGMMRTTERALYDALPASVAVYRGAVTPTAERAAEGLSWSLSRSYAAHHVYLNRFLKKHSHLDAANQAGTAHLVRVNIPKEAIFAYIGDGAQEVIVDYEALDRAGITVEKMPSDGAILLSALSTFSQRVRESVI